MKLFQDNIQNTEGFTFFVTFETKFLLSICQHSTDENATGQFRVCLIIVDRNNNFMVSCKLNSCLSNVPTFYRILLVFGATNLNEMTRQIFISSVQSEFSEERIALCEYINKDELLSAHFKAFIFENVPAQDVSPAGVYLDELERSKIYVGLFGNSYGFEDEYGLSPTEHEFNLAVEKRITRLIYIKVPEAESQHPKMARLIQKAEKQLTRRSFSGISALKGQIHTSLVQYLKDEGIISSLPLEQRSCDAGMSDLDERLIDKFVETAVASKRVGFRKGTAPIDVLTHLALAKANKLKNAAYILFSATPWHLFPGARINCVFYSGVKAVKPAIAQTVFEDDIISQINDAVAFVLSRINRDMPRRDIETAPDSNYEIPNAAIREAIVNAVAHRDYNSTALTQIALFEDRLEIRNPGELPRGLKPEQLKEVHTSIPRNPLVTDMLYRADLMNRSGTGTTDMVEVCRQWNLPEPDFLQEGDQWVVRIWRDHITEKLLQERGLSQRQITGMLAAKLRRKITTKEYMTSTNSPRTTAKRDLDELVCKGLLKLCGQGRGAYYTFK